MTHAAKIVTFQNEIMLVSDHRELVVWQRSIALALEAYPFHVDSRGRKRTAWQVRFVEPLCPSRRISPKGMAAHTGANVPTIFPSRGDRFGKSRPCWRSPSNLGYTSEEELTTIRELLDHVGRMLTRLLKRLAS